MTAPYLSVTIIERQVILSRITCRSSLSGPYQARVDGGWISVQAVEPRINTGAAPLRALHLHAADSDVLALLRLELELQRRNVLELKLGDGQIATVTFETVRGVLYLYGQPDTDLAALGEVDYTIPTGAGTLSGTGQSAIRNQGRALVISGITVEDAIAIAEAFESDNGLKVYRSLP